MSRNGNPIRQLAKANEINSNHSKHFSGQFDEIQWNACDNEFNNSRITTLEKRTGSVYKREI